MWTLTGDPDDWPWIVQFEATPDKAAQLRRARRVRDELLRELAEVEERINRLENEETPAAHGERRGLTTDESEEKQ